MTVTPLYEERQVLIAGAELLASQPNPLTWADALELPLCLLNTGMRGRQLLDDALAAHGLAARPRLEADSVVSLLAHVSGGRWASIVPQIWLHTLRTPDGVRMVPMADPQVTATVGSQAPSALGLAGLLDFSVAVTPAGARSVSDTLRVAGKVEPVFVDDIAAMPDMAIANARDGDVLMCMGAGSIGAVPGKVAELLQKEKLSTQEGRGL